MDNIIPVAVGGILAILGGAFAQWVTHRFSAKRERHKLLREKAEELCRRIDELRVWMTKLRSKAMAQEQFDDFDARPPFGMIVALVVLYFDDAQKEAANLGNRAAECSLAMASALAGIKRAQSDALEGVASGADIGQTIAMTEESCEMLKKSIAGEFKKFTAASNILMDRIVKLLQAETRN